jgi:hypothetical protein
MAEKKPRPLGRQTKYDETLIDLDHVEELASEGKIDDEIAEELGICTATYYNWRKKYPDFLEAITKGKSRADDRIEQTLNRLAQGFTRIVQKCVPGVGVVDAEEYFKPDFSAISFWLRNRRPEQWRDKHTVEQTNISTRPIQIEVWGVGGTDAMQKAIDSTQTVKPEDGAK